MDDLIRGNIYLTPDYINRHLDRIKGDLDAYNQKIIAEYEVLSQNSKYLLDNFGFDLTGRGSKLIQNLTQEEGIFKRIVTSRYSFTNYFIDENSKLYNRNQVYYCVQKDDSRVSQVIKICVFLDTNLHLLQTNLSDPLPSGSFIIASLLDDIRYKFLILYEDILVNNILLDLKEIQDLVGSAISNYYMYLLNRPQTTISNLQLHYFIVKARKFIKEYLKKFDRQHAKLRYYKEADNPFENMLFINKLKHNLPSKSDIKTLIGIRYSGIELPFLVKAFIYPKAAIELVHISKYSSQASFINLTPMNIINKDILVLDDGITSSRTLNNLIQELKKLECKNIFFGGIYFSSSKRIKHMQKDGGVNTEELQKCCILKESPYTRPASINKYTNRKGNFDKVKAKIDRRNTRYKSNTSNVIVKKQKTLSKDSIFIICDIDYITQQHKTLLYIRNYFKDTLHYQINDDWIKDRINEKGIYVEKEGRDFINEAFSDIERSNLILFLCPGPSSYVSALFILAVISKKEIWIIYNKKQDVLEFEDYEKCRLISIKKYKAILNSIS